MAKKTPEKETQKPKEKPLKVSIREYLLDEGYLREEIRDPNLELGFRFIYPDMKNQSGQELGRSFAVIKPKNKDFLEITQGTLMSPPHAEAFEKLDVKKKQQFIQDLTKAIFIKGFVTTLDFNPNRKLFAIHDRIYLGGKQQISKNLFYKSVKKIFGIAMYCVALINDAFPEAPIIDNIPRHDKVDPSLFT